jgi:hypothetical protein
LDLRRSNGRERTRQPSLLTIALAMVIVQVLDAVVGGIVRDRMKTFGPASLGALNLVALVWYLVS